MLVSSGVYRVQMTTGGQSYAATPSVAFSGGGGTGAAAVAQMAGTRVESVVITSTGTGYTAPPTVALVNATGDTAGTGAAATASVISLTAPACFFQGRFGDMYGIDGYSRGFCWSSASTSLNPIGISKPLSAATISMSSATGQGSVRSVAIVASGSGYFAAPTVTFSGGGLTDGSTDHATARAKIMNAQVVGMTITSRGGKYTSAPHIAFSGGLATGVSLSVGVAGKITGAEIVARGSGYTSAGTSAVAASISGITDATIRLNVDPDDGGINGVTVLAAGTGATTTPTITVTGGVGSGATITPTMAYTVTSITASSSGANVVARPNIVFTPDNGGASAQATVSGGALQSVQVLAGGQYASPPTAAVEPTTARAVAIIDSPMRGVYKCAYRYIDATPEDRNGPVPSSISDFVEVTADPDTVSFTWRWSNDGAESRAEKIELWRTTADQAFVLYRVATLTKTAGVLPNTYADTLTDDQLLDTLRADFGMMPIVMPSGQINARRFQPPPVNCSQAVMFQDRAWYSVDRTGQKPNSLWHSEIDEPESVPAEYEMVVQESLGQPDAIVALIALGSTLLIVQSRHIYKMTYVAQPLIDASIRLADTRGIINARCYAVLGGVAYIADYEGMYAFDGSQREDISVPVDDYWREQVIDFSKRSAFYVQALPTEKIVKFFYCQSGDGAAPTRALCYGVATKAWWEETYPTAMQCSSLLHITGRVAPVNGNAAGQLVAQNAATIDGGSTAIPYQYRTGDYALVDEPSRRLGVLYKPTASTAPVELRVFYNGSTASRPNAIQTARGDGFEATTSGAVLDMRSMRSALGPSPGFAQAHFSGRVDDRSAGGDRHMALGITGSRSSADTVRFYGVSIGGVTS